MFVSHFYGITPVSWVPAAPAIIYLGPDVHKDSVTIAVLPADAKASTRIEKYPNDFATLRRVLERHAKDGEIRAFYEASGAGYVLQRAMQWWGYPCDIIAPSLIPTTPGAQRMHDRYDSSRLDRLYRIGERNVILIPSETYGRSEAPISVRPHAVRKEGDDGVRRSPWPSAISPEICGSDPASVPGRNQWTRRVHASRLRTVSA